MKRFVFVLIVAHSCLFSATRNVWSNGVIRDSMGATSSGRGGTNIGHSDTGTIILDNPAAMVNIHGTGLSEFGIDTVITDLDYTDPENNAATKTRPGVLPEISIIRKSSDGRWAFGLGAYAPAGYSATWTLNSPLFGTNAYKSFGALGKLMPAVAFRVTDQLSFGATFGVAVSHLEFESPFFLQTGAVRGVPGILDLKGTGVTPTWSVGTQYQLSSRTTIGARFIGKTQFDYDGRFRAKVLGLGPQPVESNFDAEIELAWPSSAGAGIAHWLGDCQRISADIVWYDWSHAYDKMGLTLTNASNPLFTNMLGPVIKDSFPLGWENSVSVRLGYEIFLRNCNVCRVGYVHNTRNLPSSTLTPLIPATLEHTVSVGYGKQWCDWRFDFAYQYSFAPDRTVGTSALVGGDFTGSAIEAQAHWINLSLMRQF